MPPLFASGRRAHLPTLLAALLGACVLAGCALRSSPPPAAGYDRGAVPSFRGERVLLLPPQLIQGGHPEVEAELVWALTSRSPEVQWVGPDALRHRARESALRVNPDALAVERFLVAEVQRVGDPLFGDLYRLAAVENALWALVPVLVRERALDNGNHVVEVGAALIQPRSGRVQWYGIVEGTPAPQGDRQATLSAVEALARRLGF